MNAHLGLRVSLVNWPFYRYVIFLVTPSSFLYRILLRPLQLSSLLFPSDICLDSLNFPWFY